MKFIIIMKHKLVLMGVATIFFSGSTFAQITCSPGTQRTDTYTITPGMLSAGQDIPLGTIIYNMTWNDSNMGNQIRCNTNISGGESARTPGISLGVESAPYPLSSWNGSPFPGKVYTTNIPGVGFAVWNNGNAAIVGSPIISEPFTVTVPDSSTTQAMGSGSPLDVSLIKIGNIPPGNYTINASTFPVIKKFWPASPLIANDVVSRRITFAGTLTVVAQTCTTPDVSVNLGSYDTSVLSSAGSATPWIDASIKLTDCPVFQGYFPGATHSVQITGSTTTPPASKNNQFGIRLSPVGDIINAASGIMAVTSSANAATGVGIQIANGTPSTVGQLFNLSAELKINAPKTGVSTINIPLIARYIKTGSTVTPGRADGKVTFTVNYY